MLSSKYSYFLYTEELILLGFQLRIAGGTFVWWWRTFCKSTDLFLIWCSSRATCFPSASGTPWRNCWRSCSLHSSVLPAAGLCLSAWFRLASGADKCTCAYIGATGWVMDTFLWIQNLAWSHRWVVSSQSQDLWPMLLQAPFMTHSKMHFYNCYSLICF